MDKKKEENSVLKLWSGISYRYLKRGWERAREIYMNRKTPLTLFQVMEDMVEKKEISLM